MTKTKPAPTESHRSRIDYLPLDSVLLAEVNPKAHDDEGIRASVTRFGYVEPIVLDERTSRLVAGHGRLAALKALRERAGKTGKARGGPPSGIVLDGTAWLVPVVRGWASADDEEAAGYLLASNRLTEKGGWDNDALGSLLTRLDQHDPSLVRAAGFTDAEFSAVLDRLATPAPATGGGDPHVAPAVTRGRPLSAVGEILELGPHRLIVGDSSDPAVLGRLMDGERAACLWTDPPYGVNYVGAGARRLSIANDDPDGAIRLFAAVLEAIETAKALSPGASFYVAHPDGDLSADFRHLLRQAPWHYRQTLVWVKDQLVLGRTDHHPRHEPIALGEFAPSGPELADADLEVLDRDQLLERLEVLVMQAEEDAPAEDYQTLLAALGALASTYTPRHVAISYGQIEGGGRRGRASGQQAKAAGWYGGNAATSVFEVPRPRHSALHPTMKPLELIAAQLANSTRPGALVLDPFGGSGSTLLAAHSLGRRARLVELDPHYADVIARRWQHTSGVVPIVAGAERPYPPLTAEEQR